ncbi:MAG: hypothetical protein JWO06_2772, partial [Bacteroidota bacterium]|nr:hypothetical protein [Bacteroidota bacterium]
MRLSSKDLYRLVQTFSAKEKMLFKRFNKQAGKQAAFMILFDVLSAMKAYDEKQLQLKLKAKGVSGYLKSLKTYLYDQLIGYLRNYPGIKTKRWKMRELNIEADILFERGLRRNALELYNEQQDLATTMMNPQFELSALDNFILYASRTVDTLMLKQYETVLTEKIAAFHNLMLVQSEFRKVGAFYTEHFPVRNRQDITALNKIASSKIMLRQKNMLSPLANIFYFNFQTYIALLKNDFETAYTFALGRYKYQNTLSYQGEGIHLHRISGLELLIKAAVKSNRLEEAIGHYRRLAEICEPHRDFRTQLIKYSCFCYLNAFADWKESTTEERTKAFDFFEQYKESSPVISSGMMSLAYAFFRNKNYGPVITLVNHVITEKFSFQQSVLQTEARLLAIVTHYELKNYRLISYMVTNTRRFLKQEK